MAKQTRLDRIIADVEAALLKADPASEEYATLVNRLTALEKLREKPRTNLDPNTLIIAGANLAGIVAIIAYEQRHVVTTKALSFIMKPKL